MTKNCKNENKFKFLLEKNCNLFILRPPKPIYSKPPALQSMKFLHFFLFLWSFCLPGVGSHVDPDRHQIRIGSRYGSDNDEKSKWKWRGPSLKKPIYLLYLFSSLCFNYFLQSFCSSNLDFFLKPRVLISKKKTKLSIFPVSRVEKTYFFCILVETIQTPNIAQIFLSRLRKNLSSHGFENCLCFR